MILPPARAQIHQARCAELYKEAFLTRFAELAGNQGSPPDQLPPQQPPQDPQQQAMLGYAQGKRDAAAQRATQLASKDSKYKTQLSGAQL
jgi:hypothetical protein